MKRSTARWTTAIAATALLAMPVAGIAQTPQPSSPSAQEGQAEGPGQQKLASDHLRQAEVVLSDIPAASLKGTAQARVAELKRHITNLEQSAGEHAATPDPAAAPDTAQQRPPTGRKADLASIDRILTELLGDAARTGPSAAADTGTEGTRGTSGTTTPETGTATPPSTTTDATTPQIDENARKKLQQVRTHIAAYAAAIGSTETGAAATAAAPAGEDGTEAPTTASAPPSAESATATMSPRDPTPTATGTSATSTPQTAAPQPSSGERAAEQPAEGARRDVDTQEVKRHLTAARNALSEMTQLPAAAQLGGEARTQISQLISNFNELIATDNAWRAAHAKVRENLNALLGDPAAAHTAPPPEPAETADAVGTSGTTVDPAIREKLIEFRIHLNAFEQAASGTPAGAMSGAAKPDEPASPTTADRGDVAARSSETDPATASGSTSTGAEPRYPAGMPGRTSTQGGTDAPPVTAGTTGTSPAPHEAGDPQGPQGHQPGQPQQPAAGQAPDRDEVDREALRHIEAIEAILNGRPARPAATDREPTTGTGDLGAPTGTTGTAGAAPAPIPPTTPDSATLDAAQIEQIRTHLTELRRVLEAR